MSDMDNIAYEIRIIRIHNITISFLSELIILCMYYKISNRDYIIYIKFYHILPII